MHIPVKICECSESSSVTSLPVNTCAANSCSMTAVPIMQDPVTGICFDDILILDTKTWRWLAVEVSEAR